MMTRRCRPSSTKGKNAPSFPVDPEPFLFDGLVEWIEQLFATGNILLYGGRGLGKTWIIERFSRNWASSPARVTFQRFDCKVAADVEGLLKILDKLGAANMEALELEGLLIDNVHAAALRINPALERIPKDRLQRMKWLATSARSQSALLEEVSQHGSSSIIQSWRPLLIRPARGGVREEILDALSRLGIADRERIAKLIDELTGGHPTLVGAAFRGLAELINTLGALPERFDDSQLRALERSLHSVIANTGFGVLLHELTRLESENLDAVAYLQRVARGDPPNDDDDELFPLLESLGLLFQDLQSSTVRVPGKLLKDWLRDWSPGVREAATIDSHEIVSDGASGTFVVRVGPTTVEASLKGSQLRVLQQIVQADGEALTLDELREQTGLGTNAGVQTALYRLISTLRDRGLHDVVENVRGGRYRRGEIHYVPTDD